MFRRLADWAFHDLAAARGTYLAAAERAARRHGPDSQLALVARVDYALVLYRTGPAEQGLAEMSAVIERRRAAGGGSGDSFLRVLEIRRAGLLFQMGRFDEVERECRALAEKYEGMLGVGDAQTLRAYTDHWRVLAKLDRLKEAAVETGEVAARLAAERASDDGAVLRVRTAHAECLSALDRWDEAEVEWGDLAVVKERAGVRCTLRCSGRGKGAPKRCTAWGAVKRPRRSTET